MVDLDELENDARDPKRWHSGGGYKYVEVLPDELLELVTEVRAARATRESRPSTERDLGGHWEAHGWVPHRAEEIDDALTIGESTARIAREVEDGRLRAHAKHGANSIEGIAASDPRWLSILVEEVGEASHELTYDATGSLRGELLDIATVAIAWIAALDREEAGS